ncbi:MAG: cobyrinic acid a,c-diamide synthase [Actinomycetota bacterium]|nr:cobyrinic acid a,c-diamide synthase [Actinomycetota bacterium]
MSRRASLPGADELFRSTASPSPTKSSRGDKTPKQLVDKSTQIQVADDAVGRKGPRHETKVTFYCTNADLTQLEKVRLVLRGEHGIAADRGKVVRTALAYVIDDFEARGEDSILVRWLRADGERAGSPD